MKSNILKVSEGLWPLYSNLYNQQKEAIGSLGKHWLFKRLKGHKNTWKTLYKRTYV